MMQVIHIPPFEVERVKDKNGHHDCSNLRAKKNKTVIYAKVLQIIFQE